MQITGSWPASSQQGAGSPPQTSAPHLETRPERGRWHKLMATPCLLPPPPYLQYPNPQDTSGRSRGVGGQIPFHVPFPPGCSIPFPPGHSADQIPTSSSTLLLPPPGTQKRTNRFSSLLMLLTKGLRSKAARHRPDLEKHRFFFSPPTAVSLEKKERGGGDLITLNYHKLYPISRRADFRCKEEGEARGG